MNQCTRRASGCATELQALLDWRVFREEESDSGQPTPEHSVQLSGRRRATLASETPSLVKKRAHVVLQWQVPVPGESTYTDRYFDGGILDNTPLSAALSAVREETRRRQTGRTAAEFKAPDEAAVHEAFVVLLSPRPRKRYGGPRTTC